MMAADLAMVAKAAATVVAAAPLFHSNTNATLIACFSSVSGSMMSIVGTADTIASAIMPAK